MKTFDGSRSSPAEFFRAKFPSGNEIIFAYGLIVFIVFNWSIVNAFWRLPSWIMYATPGELTGVISYILMNDLLESLFVLALVVLASVALPFDAIRRRFVARAGALVLFTSLWVALLDFILAWSTLSAGQLLAIGALYLLSAFVFMLLFARTKFLERGMEKFCEQVSVFVYLYVPLGLLGLVVVILRNLFGWTG